MNPTNEQELDNDNALMHKIDDILYGEHKQPYSTGDSLLMLIRNQIQAHTNAEIAKVLDRLETHYWLNDDIDTLMCPEIEAFVEAERNRLNPSKSTPFNKLKEVK